MIMQDKTLCVLIPYYKNSESCEREFKKLMKIIINQSRVNFCLVICEDGQFSDWLSYYSGNIFIIYNKTNEGIARTRNKLLKAAKDFDYILFLDSDDMIDCDFIPKMYDACKSNNYDMIVSRFYYNDIKNNVKKYVDYGKRYNVSGIALRSEFIKDILFDEEYNISEDTLFISEVYKLEPRIGNIDSTYYYNFGVNENSLMMKFERSDLKLKKE